MKPTVLHISQIILETNVHLISPVRAQYPAEYQLVSEVQTFTP
nr:MAG TPA: hypothetical protein [Caudoviricetes sp.]